MNLDDDICYCFHVSLRKLLNYARRVQPRCDSQMSDCLGAGTGCGWCIPILRKIVVWSRGTAPFELPIAPSQYAAERDAYRTEPGRRNRFEAGGGAGEGAGEAAAGASDFPGAPPGELAEGSPSELPPDGEPPGGA